MVQFKKWQLFLVILFSLFAIIFSLPNFFSKEILKKLPSFIPSDQVVLGLDLQGGSYLLIEVDTESVISENFESFSDSLRLSLRKNKIPYSKYNIKTQLNVRLMDTCQEYLLGGEIKDELTEYFDTYTKENDEIYSKFSETYVIIKRNKKLYNDVNHIIEHPVKLMIHKIQILYE